jgi:serine protease Do
MVAKAKPSVVEIKTSFGSGSGFVAGDKGLIVTNAHVVDSLLPGQPATVKLQDGRAVPARVVAFNAGKDLAFLQAAAPSGLTWRALPVSKEGVREGDSIVAMGHPFGLPFTVTRGIVSGVDERGNPFVDHVQHDAGVNPGNSGGPLLNAKGEVVGVNVAILSPSGAFNGISFAISAKDLGSALEQYARIGNIDTARLGIIVNPLDARAPDYGAFVEAVRPSSPAEAAGVKPGDVIVSMDGKAFLDPGKAPEGLQRAAVRKAPDSPVEIQVVRGSRLLTLELPGGK